MRIEYDDECMDRIASYMEMLLRMKKWSSPGDWFSFEIVWKVIEEKLHPQTKSPVTIRIWWFSGNRRLSLPKAQHDIPINEIYKKTIKSLAGLIFFK